MSRLVLSRCLVVLSGLAFTSPAFAGALETAAERELVLLAGEKQELAHVKEEIEAQRSARAGTLRAQIASLEAKLVVALAASKAADAQVAALAGGQQRTPDDDAALARVILAAQQRARGGEVKTLGAALELGVARAREGTEVKRIDTGFFSADGTFVDGAVLRLGAVAAVAASGAAAGPAWQTEGGGFEVATQDATYVEQARLLVTGGSAPLVPLALGRAPGAGAEAPGFFQATARAGASAAIALLLGALSLVVSLARVASLTSALRGARLLGPRVASLVGSGELGVAAAQCRKTGGAAGRMLLAIVERARSVPHSLDRVEERASEAFLDESLALARGSLIAAALLVVGSCAALLGTLGHVRGALGAGLTGQVALLEAFIPIERALLVGAPAALCALLAHALLVRGRHELERAMVRTVDAIATTGNEVA